MKRLLILSLLVPQIIYAEHPDIKRELRIYRKSKTAEMVLLGTFGVASIGFGALFVGLAIPRLRPYLPFKNEKMDTAGKVTCIGMGSFFVLIGGVLFWATNEARKWNTMLSKPILILTSQGFTYYENNQNVQYRWEDVAKFWIETTRDQNGAEIENSWNFFIKGRQDKLKISRYDLDLSPKMQDYLISLFSAAMINNMIIQYHQ